MSALGGRAVKVMDMASASRICVARTIGRMPRWPIAAVRPFVSDIKALPPPSPTFRVLPIAWRMWAISARPSLSTIPRPPMPRPPHGHWPSIPIFSGSPAASPRKAASPRSLASSPVSAKPILIGEAAKHFARTLDGKVLYEMSGTLDTAVSSAAADAAASAAAVPVVLLSPACASYDQFKDFEQRGDAFATWSPSSRNMCEAAP